MKMAVLLRSVSCCLLKRQSTSVIKPVLYSTLSRPGVKTFLHTTKTVTISSQFARQFSGLSGQLTLLRTTEHVFRSRIVTRAFSQLTRILRQKKPLLRYKSDAINGQQISKPLTPRSSDIGRLLSLAKPERWKLAGRCNRD